MGDYNPIPATTLAEMIGAHLHRSFPYKPGRVLSSVDEADGVLSPMFGGSFDWHSSVHSHWALVRLLRDGGLPSSHIDQARDQLSQSFTANVVAEELAQLDRPHRRGFELPYGMAWALTLASELSLQNEFASWAQVFRPLAALAKDRFCHWLDAIPCAERSGQHSQSAFSMSLVFDAATVLGDDDLVERVSARARTFYAADRDGPLAWEPSAYDFLSPCLAEADLMRRVLKADFQPWFDRFLPRIEIEPVNPSDREDGKLAHFDGLNLSRAWMLRALSPFRSGLGELALAHAEAGLRSLSVASYAGTHWLPTFAVYLQTTFSK